MSSRKIYYLTDFLIILTDPFYIPNGDFFIAIKINIIFYSKQNIIANDFTVWEIYKLIPNFKFSLSMLKEKRNLEEDTSVLKNMNRSGRIFRTVM